MKALIHHLDVNRGLILSRALVAGAAGMVPVPYLDDLLANLVRESMIRRLADLRNVDADPHAIVAVATPRGSRLLTAATLGSAALGGTKRIFRRVAASLLVVRRVDEAMQTFQVGTLFDHYCARHHVGMGLDAQSATKLRLVMERAMRDTQSETLQRAFRSALRMPGAVTLALPRLLLQRWRKRGAAPVAAEKIDANLRELEKSGWLTRATTAVSGIGKGYARSLADSFDQAWETRS